MKNKITTAINKIQNHKLLGKDNVGAEMIKATGEKGIDVIYEICNKVWNTGEWPKEWCESIYISIHKKGDKENCNNFRTIALIPHTSKIMLYVIQERLKPYLLNQISPKQSGLSLGEGQETNSLTSDN